MTDELQEITDHIKRVICQDDVFFFSKEINKNVKLIVVNNTLTINEFDPNTKKEYEGEWVISGVIDDEDFTKGCLLDIFNFKNGEAVTNVANFGKEEKEFFVNLQKVEIKKAYNGEHAKSKYENTSDNCIIVYPISASNLRSDVRESINDNLTTEFNFNVGVIFKLSEADIRKKFGNWRGAEQLFMSSIAWFELSEASIVELTAIDEKEDFSNFVVFNYRLSYNKKIYGSNYVVPLEKNWKISSFDFKRDEEEPVQIDLS